MTPTMTRDRVFTPLLREIRAEALDCIQANLAIVADQHGGPGTHLALGAPLGFPIDSTAEARLAEAAALTGIRVLRRWQDLDGTDLEKLCQEHPQLYVVADAFSMPWLPYAGREHLEHSFLLTTGSSPTVIDAYSNDTQWGEIRPGVWKVDRLTLAGATAYLLDVGPAELAIPTVVLSNARGMAAAGPAVDRYLAGFDLAQLVLDVWVLARSRRLHAAWLASIGLPSAEADQQAQDWLAFAGQTFLALRRADRGTAAAPVEGEMRRLLRGDAELAERTAARLVRGVVTEALAAVLRIPPAEVLDDRPLRDLPNYNSFRLLDVIDHAEQRLGRQLEPAALTAENLRTAGSLRRLFTAGRP